MKKKILVTGATGNVGQEVIRNILDLKTNCQVVAGVRDVEKGKEKLSAFKGIGFRRFDFEDPGCFESALDEIQSVFLLRPPHIADIPKYFSPLVQCLADQNIPEVVFLSVQGADKSKVIPHNKIEKLIVGHGLNHVFLRPSYFMQNLTTTLLSDIQEKQAIILPAGKAKFNWIDINNIGEVTALVLKDFHEYAGKAFDITGLENKSFFEVAKLARKVWNSSTRYRNVNPFRFYRIKKKAGMNRGMIMVMIMLHYLQRFQKAPVISDFYHQLTGKKPTSLKEFLEREKELFS